MTEMKEQAVNLIRRIPDKNMTHVMAFLRNAETLDLQDNETENAQFPKKAGDNSPAFRRLMELRRPIPDLDEDRELAFWREGKYGYASSD